MNKPINPNHPLTMRRIEMIESALRDGTLTAAGIAGHAFMVAGSHVYRYIHYLHEAKKIHIVKWGRIGQHIVPFYAWGAGKDKPNPGRLSKAQHNKNQWKRLNADPVRKEDYLQKRRAKNIKPHRDWAIDALYGRAA